MMMAVRGPDGKRLMVSMYAIWRIAYAYDKRLQLLPSLGRLEMSSGR